jgi:hypothetical protein
MTAVELVAVAAVASWLLVLTLVVILLVREIAVLRLGGREPASSPALPEDGLMIGSPAPAALARAIGDLPDVSYLLLLSGGCRGCVELAAGLGDAEFAERLVAVIQGPPEATEDIAKLLPPWIEQVRGDQAEEIFTELEMRTTPSAFQLEAGEITGKAILRGVHELFTFAAARHRTTGDIGPQLRTVTVNGS